MCGRRMDLTNEWPICELHYDLVKDYDDFYSWSWESMYMPHGPVHFWLGGYLDCAQTYDKMADLLGSTMADIFAAESFNNRKGLYWSGIWYCEGIVDEDTPPEDVSIFHNNSCRRYAVEM